MLNYSYYPFSSGLDELTANDIAKLKAIAEGWYVDYKSQQLKTVELAKHLAAFANQYGGWLFIGIQEASDGSRCAESFPGIRKADVPNFLIQLREASSAHVNPEVLYEEKIIDGPCPEINLEQDRSIVVIGIPRGVNTPHIHSSGRIYRRVADQSKPKEETDRYILDDLWKRGYEHKNKLSEFLKKTPEIPEAQSTQAWVHVYYVLDENQPAPTDELKFNDFKKIFYSPQDHVFGVSAPMPSIYTAPFGFIARHTQGNDPCNATMTFRWWHDGIARLDIPLNTFDFDNFQNQSHKYKYADKFLELSKKQGFSSIRIVDYSMIILCIASLTNQYLHLLNCLNDKRDVYSCFTLRNVFNTSPFIDSRRFLENAEVFSIPTINDSNIVMPQNPTTESMFTHKHKLLDDWRNNTSSDNKKHTAPYLFSAPLFFALLNSVGILSDITELFKDEEIYGYGTANIEQPRAVGP